jgi:hypothetical protein
VNDERPISPKFKEGIYLRKKKFWYILESRDGVDLSWFELKSIGKYSMSQRTLLGSLEVV